MRKTSIILFSLFMMATSSLMMNGKALNATVIHGEAWNKDVIVLGDFQGNGTFSGSTIYKNTSSYLIFGNDANINGKIPSDFDITIDYGFSSACSGHLSLIFDVENLTSEGIKWSFCVMLGNAWNGTIGCDDGTIVMGIAKRSGVFIIHVWDVLSSICNDLSLPCHPGMYAFQKVNEAERLGLNITGDDGVMSSLFCLATLTHSGFNEGDSCVIATLKIGCECTTGQPITGHEPLIILGCSFSMVAIIILKIKKRVE